MLECLRLVTMLKLAIYCSHPADVVTIAVAEQSYEGYVESYSLL